MSKWRWSRFLTGSRPARRESPEAEAAARLHAPDAVSDLEVAKRPLERSILWLPAGWGEFERGEPQGYQIFVDQTVLREVAIHAGAGLEGAYGLFAGRVLIAHHARIEMRFMQQACKRCFNAPFIIPVIDTQTVARRTFERRNLAYRGGELRLAALRERYGLPRYSLHNALSDALSAAELFLAQLAQYDTARSVALNNFLLRV